MIVVMNHRASEEEVEGVLARIRELGLAGHLSQGVERTVIGVVGETYPELKDSFELLAGVEEVVLISRPF
ncbi:MAG: 3-deoxy-7-phosphoheptulonate synthase, partial [Chloroflexi bacterium]|nr:3-deoxy-7-phosphoheptulonate synthase [Chloroflexota bacterium]